MQSQQFEILTPYDNFIFALKSKEAKRQYPHRLDKFLTSLRTAYAEELNLKKDITSYDDLLDSLRLSLKGYQIK
jgi:hypothetical protein